MAMQMPLNISALADAVQQYTGVIDNSIDEAGKMKAESLNLLRSMQDQLKGITLSMYKQLGIEKSTPEECDQELTNRINTYRNIDSISRLNGTDLYNDFLKNIQSVKPLSNTNTDIILNNKLNQAYQEWVNEQGENNLTEALYNLLPKGYTLKLNEKGDYIYKKDIKTGRFTEMIRVTSTQFFGTLPNKLKEALQKTDQFKSITDPVISTNTDNDTISTTITFTDETMYQLLNTTYNGKGKTLNINQIAQIMGVSPEEIVRAVKDFLLTKLLSYSANSTYQQCVAEVINKTNPVDIFAGGNAVNNLIGLVGEIQALYYIRSLLPNIPPIDIKEVQWVGADTVTGKKPHADLVLQLANKFFGIQVKNTAKPVTDRNFVNFDTINAITGTFSDNKWDLTINNADKLLETALGDRSSQNILEASFMIKSMEAFNIPYIRKSTRKGTLYEKVSSFSDLPQNEKTDSFISLRTILENYQEKANRALSLFLVGLMYMQSTLYEKEELGRTSNTLYIYGGTLAISSAGIISKLITELEQEIVSNSLPVQFTAHFRQGNYNPDTQKFENAESVKNIVDYFNDNSRRDLRIGLQSAYTFI